MAYRTCYFRREDGTKLNRYFIFDTTAELLTSTLIVGDLAYAVDTGVFYVADSPTSFSSINSAGTPGTVTTVSVTTANGVSGSVANATTTPAITLSLGAITPTTIVASGAVSGSNLSGTNTGDQDLSSLAPKASPTFTGTVTIPTPFTLGAVSVTPTGTELNYVDGVTSSIQTQLDNKPIAIIGVYTAAARTTSFFTTVYRNTFQTSESNCSAWRVPFACVLRNLYIDVQTAPAAGKSWTATLRDDAADTALTCAIVDANTSANDTTNSATVAAGSVITLKVVAAGTPTDLVAFSWSCGVYTV